MGCGPGWVKGLFTLMFNRCGDFSEKSASFVTDKWSGFMLDVSTYENSTVGFRNYQQL